MGREFEFMPNDIRDQYSSSILKFSKCLIKLYGRG